MTTVEELLTGPVTGAEGRRFIRDLLATAPQPIPVQVLDTPGTPESAIVFALGEGEAVRSADRILFARSAFRSTASLAWLRIVALEEFGVTPRDADYATTNLTVTNASGALYGPFAAGEIRFVNNATDPPSVYANDATVSFAVGPSVTSVGIRAIEPGSASTANVGEIDSLETPLEGVTCTNAQPAIGQDAQDIESLNASIDARLGTFGVGGSFSTGGATSSYDSIARNGVDLGGGVPRADGTRITVTRTKLVLDILSGIYTLYVADEDGPLASGDLALVESAVQTYAEWIGAQIVVANVSMVPLEVNGALTIAKCAAYDAALLDAIDAALLDATQRTPIGGYSGAISVRYVENIIESVGDAGKTTAFTLVDVALSTPTAPTALADNEVLIASRGTISITRVT